MKPVHLVMLAAVVSALGLLLLLQGPSIDNGVTRLPRRMHHSGPQHIKHKKEGKHNEAFDHAGFDPEVPSLRPLSTLTLREVPARRDAEMSKRLQVAHHAGEYEEYFDAYGNEDWRGGEDDEWWDEHYAQRGGYGGFNISHRLEVRTTHVLAGARLVGVR